MSCETMADRGDLHTLNPVGVISPDSPEFESAGEGRLNQPDDIITKQDIQPPASAPEFQEASHKEVKATVFEKKKEISHPFPPKLDKLRIMIPSLPTVTEQELPLVTQSALAHRLGMRAVDNVVRMRHERGGFTLTQHRPGERHAHLRRLTNGTYVDVDLNIAVPTQAAKYGTEETFTGSDLIATHPEWSSAVGKYYPFLTDYKGNLIFKGYIEDVPVFEIDISGSTEKPANWTAISDQLQEATKRLFNLNPNTPNIVKTEKVYETDDSAAWRISDNERETSEVLTALAHDISIGWNVLVDGSRRRVSIMFHPETVLTPPTEGLTTPTTREKTPKWTIDYKKPIEYKKDGKKEEASAITYTDASGVTRYVYSTEDLAKLLQHPEFKWLFPPALVEKFKKEFPRVYAPQNPVQMNGEAIFEYISKYS